MLNLKTFWIFFISVLFLTLFSYPSLYLFGLSTLWGGLFLQMYQAWTLFLLGIVFFYPFVRAALFMTDRYYYFGFLSMLGGIVVPFFSGVIAIFVIEIFQKHKN